MGAETVTLTGTSPDGFPSGLLATAEGSAPGAGNAGNILVETRTLTVRAEAQITNSTFGPGAGGTIRLTVGDRFSMTERALINTSSSLVGAAGTVIIETGELAVLSGSGITSLTSGTGHAGSIDITGRTSILVSGSRASAIDPSTPSVSTVASSTLLTPLFEEVFGVTGGDAGRVTIQTPRLTIEDQGTITTTSFNTGQGGNIIATVGTAAILSGG